jgi:pyruvate, orthophosphate dikinase
MGEARQLTSQQVAMLRLLSAGGMIDEPRMRSLLEQRAVFSGEGTGRCLASLIEGGLVESPLPDLLSITESGKKALRGFIQARRWHMIPLLQERVWADFEALDTEFKKVCLMWQVRQDRTSSPNTPNIPNTHDDPEYDFGVLGRLEEVHSRLRDLVGSVSGLDAELADLTVELDNAMTRIGEGEFDYFTGVQLNSFHNLWFELHEDLLCTMGLERSE